MVYLPVSRGNHALRRLLTRENILKLIQELHEHRIMRGQEGKKNCASDENILAEAEKRLHQEFSQVLHMSLEETIAYIRQNLIV